MSAFATLEDVSVLYRALTADEEDRAEALLPIVSDCLRYEASKAGKNLDQMLSEDDALVNVATSVVCDVVGRCLMTPTNETPQTQYSQSALGYSVSGTYLVPGGGLFIKRSELARLGIKRQKIGSVSLWE